MSHHLTRWYCATGLRSIALRHFQGRHLGCPRVTGAWTCFRRNAANGGEGDAVTSEKSIYDRMREKLGPFSTAPLFPEGAMSVTVISGPSGVGKDSVIHALQKRRTDLHFIVTAATRAKREGEVDGVDYHFVSKETFQRWIAEDRMYEYAMVYGDYKGVPKSQIENAFAKGKDCIMRLDVQGAAHVRKVHPDCITIYIAPYSEDELVRRLISRQTETLNEVMLRVQTAREELKRASEFDYVVVNKGGEIDVAVERICSILDAEKSSKRARQHHPDAHDSHQ